MEKSELKPLFLKNPLLAIWLAAQSPKILSGCKVLMPDEMPEKYREFSSKLKLKKPPTVVVCKDLLEIKDADAAYNALLDAIFLNEVTLNNLLLTEQSSGSDCSDYIVAHELGHKKDNFSRREFIRILKAGAGGAILGASIYKSIDSITEDLENQTKEQAPYFSTTLSAFKYVVSFGTGIGLLTVFSNLFPSNDRKDEFAADDYAKDVLGLGNIISFHLARIRGKQDKNHNSAIEDIIEGIDEQISKNQIPISADERQFLIALEVIKHYEQYRTPLSDIVARDIYPDYYERLKHQEDEMREAVKSARQKRNSRGL